MENKIVVHLVPSAHWDREWYLPFSRYQVRLVRLMDKVISLLDSGKYPFYILDGQTAMLDDYLEVKPEKKEILQKLITEGKLVVGPWYTVPDTFIPCGESLWKNMLLGERTKKEFGGKGEVAYTPDAFGLNSQMAQIFRHFQYRYAMYTRGYRLQKAEDSGVKCDVTLVSPDGSSVLAENDKYSLGNGLVVPNIWRNFAKLKVEKADALRCANWVLDYQAKKTTAKNRLWICGIDHLEPREDLPQIAELLNKEITGVTFKISSMDAFFTALEKEGVCSENVALGEQRGDYKKHFELGNTLSSRMDIKLLNRETENLLFSYAEGLDLYPRICPEFDTLDRDAVLENAYKHLIRSHAHDSICTCGVDEMCTDVKSRIRWAKEAGEEVLKDDLQKIGDSLVKKTADGEILVYNPLPFTRSEILEGKLSIPYDVDGDCILDDTGNELENSSVEILFKKRIDIETSKYVRFEEIEKDVTRLTIMPVAKAGDIQTGIYYRFEAKDVPPLGFKRFTLGKRKTCVTTAKTDVKTTDFIDNEYLSVSVNDGGMVELKDKTTGICLQKLCLPVCDIDEGDTYTYANVSGVKSRLPHSCKILERKRDALASELAVEYTVGIPDVAAQEKNLTLQTTFRLQKSDKKLYVRTKVKNDGENFRIRVMIETPGATGYVASDTAFDFVKRPVYQKAELSPENIMTMPCRNLVFVPADRFDTAIYTKSFQEYESWLEGEKTVTALTLMRSLSQVYNTNLPTKNESALGTGPRWLTEDGKMHGEYSFEYAIELLPKNTEINEVFNRALAYQLPLYPFGIAPCGEKEAEDYQGFSLDGGVFSALERRDGKLFVRVYNPEEKPTELVLTYGKIKKVMPLAAKRIAEIDITDWRKI